MDDLTLARQLDTLVAAGLVREQGPGQYAFRHALICDAVYSTLLVKDRKAYHRAIGDTILDLSRDALDERLADLSLHYYQAGEWDAALEYSRRAAERARAMYAPRETIEHLDRALQAARQVQSPLLSTLLRERAQAHETLGDFERAQADYAESFAEAQARHGRRDEWQALVGLGFLWASRDYARTGEYLKQALALARTMDDPHLVGTILHAREFHGEADAHYILGLSKLGLDPQGEPWNTDKAATPAGPVTPEPVTRAADPRGRILELNRKLEEVLEGNIREYETLSMFQRPIIKRMFQQGTGLKVEDWLAAAREMTRQLETGESTNPARWGEYAAQLKRLAAFITKQESDARGWIKDPQQLRAALAALQERKDTVTALEAAVGELAVGVV